MEKKVSIYDIANYLNLSVATVSYVINGKGKISEKTRNKVNEAIKELGYVVNTTARTLSTGKSHLIGLLLPLDNTSSALISNPFYVEFIGGIEKEISCHDYDLVISTITTNTKIIDWVLSRGLDGLIMLGKYPKDIYEKIKESKVPVALTDIYEDYSKEFFNVRVDDEYGMYLATRHLLENGHTKIGFVGNMYVSLVDKQRYNGYKKALLEYNIKDEYIFECLSTFDDGYKIADKIKDSIVTGVVCTADITAIGIMNRYNNQNLKIPDDLSIVGFDDISDAKYVYPPLTTIRQDIQNKGIQTAKMIINSLEGNDDSVALQVTIPSLVIRESTKKCDR